MFLTNNEVVRLTGRHRRTQQKQVLEALGIVYIENGIDELVISTVHVERVLSDITHHGIETGPNFNALRKVS
ncbi:MULTISPECIES: DUF4224 domain-containing protein [unclassified Marinobacter]|uniref:DUF4224 domain-containing protein n=1 Tax=unclassified Marinobacter TaxID=83889 RepID=UPI000BF6D85C|nr:MULTISPECIES: DUF4224 domain-containing protein [unclassified Marinobacter]PFG08863.1 uncharacterized protein DUF4224 [Marinobacter sp. LV10MA510-1]PFG54729.1 uncharacterized protein DUF4224 [Marinobacter sp. LV10R520-4]